MSKSELLLKEKPTLKDLQAYTAQMVIERGFEKETAPELFMLFLEECVELAKAARKYQNIHTDKNSKQFNIEEEEIFTAEAIESGLSAETFSTRIDDAAEDFDPFEMMMSGATENIQKLKVCEYNTLFSDLDYLRSAMTYFSKTERHPVENLATVEGVEIAVTSDLRRRLAALLPEEAMPANDFLRLSTDKTFCMDEMKRSMQNNMSETAWPTTQFLWPLHPIYNWVNDKAGLLFNRGESPIIGVPSTLSISEFVFIVAGTIPNRKSAPVVDEWFGLHYKDNLFIEELSMDQVISKTNFGKNDMPNRNLIISENVINASALLPDVVKEAKKVLERYCDKYRIEINPKINDELDKLSDLQVRHMDYQLSLFESARKKSEQHRKVEKIFDEFTDWVKDTLEIENNPYLRVIAVLTGV